MNERLGMTLRDYFAAKAMQALIPRGETIETMKYAESAYAMADEMLKARGLSLYTAPQPKREWVGLTDEEVSEIIGKEIGFNSCFGPEESFARAIEAKLKEKNG